MASDITRENRDSIQVNGWRYVVVEPLTDLEITQLRALLHLEALCSHHGSFTHCCELGDCHDPVLTHQPCGHVVRKFA
jgi:hypothetical protein